MSMSVPLATSNLFGAEDTHLANGFWGLALHLLREAAAPSFSAPRVAAGLMLCGLAFCGLTWRWASYLSRRPPCERVRVVLLLVLALASGFELALCLAGFLELWMTPIILLANAWGPLDAVLRYPAVHDVDTFFTVKQVTLLCAKLVSFPFGFVELLDHLCLLVALCLVNFVVLPVFYLVALPLDRSLEEQRNVAKGVADIDLALRLAALAKERRRSVPSLLATPGRTLLPLWHSGAKAEPKGDDARSRRRRLLAR